MRMCSEEESSPLRSPLCESEIYPSKVRPCVWEDGGDWLQVKQAVRQRQDRDISLTYAVLSKTETASLSVGYGEFIAMFV